MSTQKAMKEQGCWWYTLRMEIKLQGGPYDQRTWIINNGNTEILRLGAPVDNGGNSRWYIYRRTIRQDENGLPVFLFTWQTDDDDDDGPSPDELVGRD
jgi:hypothetical protein